MNDVVALAQPTRELAAQVREELAWLFADLPDVRCGVVTGGTSVAREQMQLKRRPAVLVGTPGRLNDHLRTGALSLASVCQLVLDEADQMLDLGFKDELDAILQALPAQRRTRPSPFASRARGEAPGRARAGRRPGAPRAARRGPILRISPAVARST